MVARGLTVVRVHPNAKNPVGVNWGERSTRSPEVVSTWPADSNYGIMPRDGFVIIDLDAPKKAGDPTVRQTWDLLNPTKKLTVRTPSGGRHLIYRAPPGVQLENSIKRVPGVDVIAHGQKQAVGPGSVINGKPYEIICAAP